jgi:hypothetical protein
MKIKISDLKPNPFKKRVVLQKQLLSTTDSKDIKLLQEQIARR